MLVTNRQPLDVISSSDINNIAEVINHLETLMSEVNVIWSGTAYPAQAGSPPGGVTVRHFYGPEPYAGATWAGVVDVYTYADL